MRLIRLKIDDDKGFRSLQKGFEINFLLSPNHDMTDFNPYIFVGLNGSGKSNVLEVLASIFYHIECMYLNNKPTSFDYDEHDSIHGFRPENSIPDAFELEYMISKPLNRELRGMAHIHIIKKQQKSPQIYWVNRTDHPEEPLTGFEAKEVLPDYILGYSSGDNEILSLPFFKMRYIHFDEYISRLLRQEGYSGTPEGRLTYLSDEYSQAILISNFLLQDKRLLKPFEDHVGLLELKQMRIIIKDKIVLTNDQFDEYTQRLDYALDSSNDFMQVVNTDMGTIHIFSITKYLDGPDSIISKLKSCATCSFYNYDTNEWYLDYYIDEETRKAFEFHFGSALELFQSFQILLTLNLYSTSVQLKQELYQSTSLYINETVPTLASDKRIMRFKEIYVAKSSITEKLLMKALSDGEHQFIHSLGLCLLYKDKNCLFLLDEPETHFNPNWRAKFISSIRNCFNDISLSNQVLPIRDMLITTHTPYLVSDCKPEYVFIFHQAIDGTIEVSHPDYNTFGASINQITDWTFRYQKSIGDYAQMMINNITAEVKSSKSKEELEELLKQTQRLGDSVEKILLVQKIIAYMEEMI